MASPPFGESPSVLPASSCGPPFCGRPNRLPLAIVNAAIFACMEKSMVGHVGTNDELCPRMMMHLFWIPEKAS